jgi:hypothetical protein
VLGRRSGAGSSASKKGSALGIGGGLGGASPARTPSYTQQHDPFSKSPAARSGAAPPNAVASRAQLQQEIRVWRRQLARAQAIGNQFAERSGPDSEWVFKYLAIEADQQHAEAYAHA